MSELSVNEKDKLYAKYIEVIGSPPLIDYGFDDSPEFWDAVRRSVESGKPMASLIDANLPDGAVA